MENHRQEPWHSQSIDEVYELLNTSSSGLSEAEAVRRLNTWGRNELQKKAVRTVWQMLITQIKDVMILILIGAAAFSFFLNEWTEGVVIISIVILNTIIGMA